jgi:DnaK suppressor protein
MPSKGRGTLTQKEKERHKKKLLEKKKEIIDELREFQNESKMIETGIAQDLGDKAESSYTKEFLLSLSDAEREHLTLIDAALKRIDKDEFGSCLSCDKKIGKKRLNVIPWASYCISCQEKEDQKF